MTESKVDHGIKLPPKMKPTKQSHLLDEMKAGDSVFFPTRARADNLRLAGKYRGYNMTARAVEGGFRVWRVK